MPSESAAERAFHNFAGLDDITDLDVLESVKPLSPEETINYVTVMLAHIAEGKLNHAFYDKKSMISVIDTLQMAAFCARSELERAVNTDAVTAIPNRRRFDRETVPERRAYAILFFDVDNFKDFNTHLGHSLGDLVLKEVAYLLSSAVSEGIAGIYKDGADLTARYGGEEFVSIVKNIDQDGTLNQYEAYDLAYRIAERARKRIEDEATVIFRNYLDESNNHKTIKTLDERGLGITVSVGVAMSYDSAERRQVQNNANAAMLVAKASGKNQAVKYIPGMGETNDAVAQGCDVHEIKRIQ